jgi:hypothetical protein
VKSTNIRCITITSNSYAVAGQVNGVLHKGLEFKTYVTKILLAHSNRCNLTAPVKNLSYNLIVNILWETADENCTTAWGLIPRSWRRGGGIWWEESAGLAVDDLFGRARGLLLLLLLLLS